MRRATRGTPRAFTCVSAVRSCVQCEVHSVHLLYCSCSVVRAPIAAATERNARCRERRAAPRRVLLFAVEPIFTFPPVKKCEFSMRRALHSRLEAKGGTCPIPFRSIPFRLIRFDSIPFHTAPLRFRHFHFARRSATAVAARAAAPFTAAAL